MTETIQSTDLRRRVREVLDRVGRKGEPVIVQTYDTPRAVLIPYEDFRGLPGVADASRGAPGVVGRTEDHRYRGQCPCRSVG